MENSITRAEHEEFARRMEDEHHRLNVRIKSVEEKTDTLTRLTTSVESLAKSVEAVTQRLEKLEQKPAENWNTVVKGVLTAVGSALGGGLIVIVATYLIGG